MPTTAYVTIQDQETSTERMGGGVKILARTVESNMSPFRKLDDVFILHESLLFVRPYKCIATFKVMRFEL